MHPGRRSILVRWIAYVMVIAATASWLYVDQRAVEPQSSDVMMRLTPKKVDLPPDEVTTAIREAIDAVSQKIPNYGAVEKVDPALVVLDPAVLDDKAQYATLFVSALFLGPPDKYAILNGTVYRQGDELPDGRVLTAIDAEGVTLSLAGGSERVSWLPPYRVELKKPVSQPGTGDADTATTTETAAADQTQQTPAMDLNNLPPDLTPDQALQILQQVGKKQ